MIAVRLSDVRPDGKATRITYGLLNLTHRDSRSNPVRLEPGKRYHVTVQMNDIAQHFPKGHKIRLAISSSYWPLAWPSPEATCLTIHTGKSRLALPERAPQEMDESIHFAPPEMAEAPPITMIEPSHHNWFVHRDLASDLSTLEIIGDGGTVKLEDIDLTLKAKTTEWYSCQGDDFNSVKGETLSESSYKRENWSIATRTYTCLTSDKHYFYINAELDAFEDTARIYSNNWNIKIQRDFV